MKFLIFSLFKIREHGIQGREKSRIYTDKPVCSSNTQNFGSVRLIDCYAAFLILCYGIAVSFTILFVENFYKRKCCLKRPEN